MPLAPRCRRRVRGGPGKTPKTATVEEEEGRPRLAWAPLKREIQCESSAQTLSSRNIFPDIASNRSICHHQRVVEQYGISMGRAATRSGAMHEPGAQCLGCQQLQPRPHSADEDADILNALSLSASDKATTVARRGPSPWRKLRNLCFYEEIYGRTIRTHFVHFRLRGREGFRALHS